MVADLRYLAVIAALLLGCNTETGSTPATMGYLRHWEDADAGVRCYANPLLEHAFSCVKFR